MFDRRQMLRFAGFGAGLSILPAPLFSASLSPKRLVFIIQRGAADGLGTVIPVADPGLSALRGALAVEAPHKLDSFFALHPSMVNAARLFAEKQAMFIHAVASPYRERSHFDAQNVLETGGAAPYALKSGWLNRLAGVIGAQDAKALALSPVIPVGLRGDAPVTSYASSALPDASADLISRVTQLYAGDAQLHKLWDQALATRSMAAGADAGLNARNAAGMGALAAKLMTGPNGARIAMMETTGWDTHSGQKARLAGQLRGLDAMVEAIRTGLGADWANTLVIVATEFGRTAAVNGTGGTDHGTASAAMLFGGGLKGGKVKADWPGLLPANLYEGRDLRPTIALDGLITSALASHFGQDPVKLGRALFPEMKSPVISL